MAVLLPCPRRGLLVAWGLLAPLAVASAARAQDAGRCRFEVQVEGTPDDRAFSEALREEVLRSHTCARPWKLRVTPGPRGQYKIALDSGASVETRVASNSREVTPVAALLMRLMAAADPAPPPPEPPPPARTAAPEGSMEAPDRYAIALTVGPTWASHAGVGPEGGLEFTIGGAHLRAGLGGRLARVSGDAARSELGVSAVGQAQFYPAPSLALGLGVEAGLGAQSAEATAGGRTMSTSAAGLVVGASPFVAWHLGSSWWLRAAVPVRLSTASATPASETTTVAPGNSGNSNGNGKGKNEKEVTQVPPAARAAADALGGLTVSLAVGVVYAF